MLAGNIVEHLEVKEPVGWVEQSEWCCSVSLWCVNRKLFASKFNLKSQLVSAAPKWPNSVIAALSICFILKLADVRWLVTSRGSILGSQIWILVCLLSTEVDNLTFSYLSYCSLNACNLTVTCCEVLANGISSSQLRELDLGNNNLTDAGIIKLSGGLKNSKLEALRSVSNEFLSFFPPNQNKDVFVQHFLCVFRLRSCNLTGHSSDALASVISSESCLLKLLDLSDNDLLDEGVKKLSGGLASPHCKLEILKWVAWNLMPDELFNSRTEPNMEIHCLCVCFEVCPCAD